MSVAVTLKRSSKRFCADRSGVTVIEFAILAPLFFMIVAATLETAMVFFAGQALDTAVSNSTRAVRVGQTQAMSAEQYRDEICSGLYGLLDCAQLRILLQPMDSFADFSETDPVDRDSGEWAVDDTYDTGTGSSVMVVRAYYKFPSILAVPGMSAGLLPDNTRLLATARVFMNEPF